MCGTSNSSVDPRIRYVDNDDVVVLDTNISIKNRMTISTLFMKFNLYGFVIAWIKEAHATKTPSISDVRAGRRW